MLVNSSSLRRRLCAGVALGLLVVGLVGCASGDSGSSGDTASPSAAANPREPASESSPVGSAEPAPEAPAASNDELDPALVVARRVAAAHPHVPSRVVADARRVGRNPKVNNLANLARVDRDHHVLVGYLDGDPEPAGIVRLVRDGSSAEVAFAVADSYHGRGVGSILASELAADARAAGDDDVGEKFDALTQFGFGSDVAEGADGCAFADPGAGFDDGARVNAHCGPACRRLRHDVT